MRRGDIEDNFVFSSSSFFNEMSNLLCLISIELEILNTKYILRYIHPRTCRFWDIWLCSSYYFRYETYCTMRIGNTSNAMKWRNSTVFWHHLTFLRRIVVRPTRYPFLHLRCSFTDSFLCCSSTCNVRLTYVRTYIDIVLSLYDRLLFGRLVLSL